MPWSDGLDPDLDLELRAQFPGLSLREIGIAVYTWTQDRPSFAEDFDELGADIWTYAKRPGYREPDEPPYLDFPERNKEAVQALVVAAAHALATAREQDALPLGIDLDLGGLPYPPRELNAIGKARAQGKKSIRAAQAAAGISYRRGRRAHSWFEAGAVQWDKARGLRPGPGYQLINAGTGVQALKLIRLDPPQSGSALR
jgi:hypothetical protein